MERYIKSTSHNMIHLCVDKVQDYQIQGVVYNNTLEEPFQFTDIHNLVLNIDKIFDQNGNPQSSQIKRSFQNKSVLHIFN